MKNYTVNIDITADHETGFRDGQSHPECSLCGSVVVPYKFRELHPADRNKPAACCGIRAGSHYDGWDGNYLDCDEAKRRGGR